MIPRIIWNIVIYTKPVSDFLLYQNYAVNISKGIYHIFDKSYLVFPFKFGYPLILGYIYKVFGAFEWTTKIMNISLSIVLALLIYNICKYLFDNKVGIIVSFLFAIWPAQIMFTSVLASEHLFMVFFIASILIFLKIIDGHYSNAKIFYIIILGINLTLAQLIRPISVILFPPFIIYLFLFNKNIHLKKLSRKAFIILLITISFMSFNIFINHLVSNKIHVSIAKSSSGYNLLIGTNFKYSGKYNSDDASILKEYNYDYKKVHSEAFKRAYKRIISEPIMFLKLIEKKFVIQWASEDYGIYWSTVKLNRAFPENINIIKFRKYFNLFSLTIYLIYIIFAILGIFCCYKQNRNNYYVILLLIMIEFVISFTFLEVQSRYHYPVVPFFIIMAGYGFNNIKQFLKVS